MRVLTLPFELAWHLLNRVRRALYQAGVFKPRHLPAPVVSIGNIAAGGTGKTPAIITIARHLTAAGFRVAILTRGYGRLGGGGPVTALNAAQFGDEPVLIKKYAPNADVIVGNNRYDHGRDIKCDLYLLDDGFQHLQLHRDLDIVIDVPASPFCREGRSALEDADIVIPRRIRATGLESLRGQRVFAFAGLADNEQFFQMLRDGGLELSGTRSFPDHHRYTSADIHDLRKVGDGLLVTTEKDWVKIGADDIIAIPIEFDIEPRVLERIVELVRR